MLNTRELKRMAKRATKQPGRAKQRHLSNADLVCKNGLGKFSRFVPLTQEQEDKCEIFLRLRLKLCREGSKTNDDWLSVLSGLMEGYAISGFAFDEVGRHDYRRQFASAAKLWDAAYLHFQRTGEVLASNFDVIADAVDLVCAMKKQMGRHELLGIVSVMRDCFDSYLIQMLGGNPKSIRLEQEKK